MFSNQTAWTVPIFFVKETSGLCVNALVVVYKRTAVAFSRWACGIILTANMALVESVIALKGWGELTSPGMSFVRSRGTKAF